MEQLNAVVYCRGNIQKELIRSIRNYILLPKGTVIQSYVQLCHLVILTI